MTKLIKCAMFGDIHHGKKNNASTHNQDCTRFIEWFCDMVSDDSTIDHVVFLGDWHENRSAINISTMNYSYENATLLSKLGLPIYHIVGNHDLYNRHSREIHSNIIFKSLDNYTIIDECVVLENTLNPTLLSPFLFDSEYASLAQYMNIPIWMGHFEFKNFVVSGHSYRMPTGPDIADYAKPKHIFSGHFHKRQQEKNVTYIGNAFPMDFSDSNDFDRGFATYNHEGDELTFINWESCPKYIKTTLTDIVNCQDLSQYDDAKVKCMMDQNLTYEEVMEVRKTIETTFNIRELVFEEPDVEMEVGLEALDIEHLDVEDTIIELLGRVSLEKIDAQKLIEVFAKI